MTQTKTSKRFWTILLGAGGLLAVAAVAFVLLTGGDDDPGSKSSVTKATPASDELPDFTMAYPDGWKQVKVRERPDDAPRATIQRGDGGALVTITINGPVKQSLDSLRGDLADEISSLKGATGVTSKRVEVAAGSALHTTWKMKDTGRIQSNLVVPAGKYSFQLDAVVTGNEKAANEVGDIFSAFETE